MASRMRKVYELDLHVEYGSYVKYMSADLEVSIFRIKNLTTRITCPR
jgi:hypothetical protein